MLINNLTELLCDGDIAAQCQVRSYFTLEDVILLAQIRDQKEKAAH